MAEIDQLPELGKNGDDIEVTEEMEAAGAAIIASIEDSRVDPYTRFVARAIFIAMAKAGRR